ncbi:GL22377 [Drosophila persimilis]|uniref:GL22377 n=1 Tax=Drosophila persimilis TaxID=7234 RepID=B4IR87_DROPE|nr:GL22377 [Drosophila persimilis]
MNCDHQREVTELKRSHQMQLLDALEEARLKHEQIETGIPGELHAGSRVHHRRS